MSDQELSSETREIQGKPGVSEPNGHDPSPDGHAAETAIELVAKTLAGDLRDRLWSRLRDHAVLLKMSEGAQRALADGIFADCAAIVSAGVSLIAGRSFPTISVALEQVTFKPKGIETKMAMSGLDRVRRHELVDAQGKVILLVVADPGAFMGTRGPVQIDAAAELPLAAGAGVPPHAEAHKTGYEDALDGARASNPFPPGVYGHADYMLGYAEGEEERAAAGQPVEQEPEPEAPPARKRGRRASAEAAV